MYFTINSFLPKDDDVRFPHLGEIPAKQTYDIE